MLVGYARVSQNDQSLALQLDALRAAGVEKIFSDTASGSRQDRPGLREALEFARAGDCLVVWRLDRLGRSLPHLIELMQDMATVLKRLLTLGLALAFLVGVTVQLVPSSMAEIETTASAGMAGCCDSPQPPCSGKPNCLDHVGCVTVSAIPTSPTSVAVAFEWTPLDYDLAAESLTGLSVKPELSPPILAA